MFKDIRAGEDLLFRINTEKGSCQVIQGGRPIKNPDGGGLLFPLYGVVFVGSSFSQVESDGLPSVDSRGAFILCVIRQGLIDIPFRESGRSDVRHLYIQSKWHFHFFPVFVRYVQNPLVGGIQEGEFQRLILVLPVNYGRDKIMKLRLAFPKALVIVARQGAPLYVNPYLVHRPEEASNVRATDLVTEVDLEKIKNPSFVARVYLRNLELEKMQELPYRFVVQENDLRVILSFLDTMIGKAPEVSSLADLLPKLEALRDKYFLFAELLSADSERIKKACLALSKEELLDCQSFIQKQQEWQPQNTVLSKVATVLDSLAVE